MGIESESRGSESQESGLETGVGSRATIRRMDRSEFERKYQALGELALEYLARPRDSVFPMEA